LWSISLKTSIIRAVALLAFTAVAPLASAVPTCSVATGGTLSFGTIVPLASSPDVTSNTGSSFWVNCSSDVATAPAIYSISPRTMSNGISSLPFHLSAESPSGLSLSSSSPGSPLSISNDGNNQTVTLYGRIRTVDYQGLSSGLYTAVVWLTVEY
jgi:spore coat protein U-like protein